jgi:hypothetical protein
VPKAQDEAAQYELDRVVTAIDKLQLERALGELLVDAETDGDKTNPPPWRPL